MTQSAGFGTSCASSRGRGSVRSRSQDGTTRYAAVQSCHGSGKSFSNLRVVAQCPPSGRGVHLTAAPTCKQIHAVLWREMGRAPPCSRSARLHQAGRRAEYRGPSSSASGASPPMPKIRWACNRRFTRRRSKQSLLNLRNGTNTDYLKTSNFDSLIGGNTSGGVVSSLAGLGSSMSRRLLCRARRQAGH